MKRHLLCKCFFNEVKKMAQEKLFYFDDWKNPPCPSDYNCTTATIVNEARGLTGFVQGTVLRPDVLAVEMSWNVISVEDWQKLLAKFDSTKGGSFFRYVHVFDQARNGWRKAVFYVSDRDGGKLGILDKNGRPRYWKNANLTLIMK